MKSGPLDQTRFKSGHQISQTSRLKRRLDLDRRIFCTTDLSHKQPRRYISQKNQKKISHARVSHVSIFRSNSDISPKYRRYLPIFLDFSCKQLSVSKIVSLTPDIRYIAEISADISDISILVLDVVELCGELLGVTPPANALRGLTISIRWLCQQLSTPGPDADEVDLERSVHGFILALMGSFLFPCSPVLSPTTPGFDTDIDL